MIQGRVPDDDRPRPCRAAESSLWAGHHDRARMGQPSTRSVLTRKLGRLGASIRVDDPKRTVCILQSKANEGSESQIQAQPGARSYRIGLLSTLTITDVIGRAGGSTNRGGLNSVHRTWIVVEQLSDRSMMLNRKSLRDCSTGFVSEDFFHSGCSKHGDSRRNPGTVRFNPLAR